MRFSILFAVLLGLSAMGCTQGSGPVPPFKVGDTIVFNVTFRELSECSYKGRLHTVEEIRGPLFKLGDGRWVNLYQVQEFRVCSSGD